MGVVTPSVSRHELFFLSRPVVRPHMSAMLVLSRRQTVPVFGPRKPVTDDHLCRLGDGENCVLRLRTLCHDEGRNFGLAKHRRHGLRHGELNPGQWCLLQEPLTQHVPRKHQNYFSKRSHWQRNLLACVTGSARQFLNRASASNLEWCPAVVFFGATTASGSACTLTLDLFSESTAAAAAAKRLF